MWQTDGHPQSRAAATVTLRHSVKVAQMLVNTSPAKQAAPF
jgi:hypothetical protein